VTEHLKYVSFREYLFLKHHILLSSISWTDLIHPLFYKKIPSLFKTNFNLQKEFKIYLALSPIPTLTIDSLAKNWAISKTTVYNLLEVMNDSGILRIVAGKKQKTLSKGKKIFFSDPNLYFALEGNLGNVRESYFVMAIDKIGKKIVCPDDDSDGDFIVDHLIFEIGGKNKSRKKSDFVVKDNIDSPSKGEVPIWILGFLA
jgi:uncharacterized protein